MRSLQRLVTGIVTLLATGSVLAAEDIGTAARACRTETNDARRLACYDRAVDRSMSAATEPAKVTAPAAPAPQAATVAAASATAAAAATSAPAASTPAVGPAPSQTSQENFGLEQQKAAEEDQRRKEESRAAGELRATILDIQTRSDGLMTFSLDNGQVWRQNTPDSKFRAKTGDRVLIQPGSFNSFILSGPTKKSTRVTRVK